MKKLRLMNSLVLTAAMSLSAFAQGGSGQAPRAASAAPREILIQNATIMTASRGTIRNGSILIRDGKIAAVGANVRARDANAQVIDATGKYVIPGIIDAHSHTAGEGNINEGSLSVTSMVRIKDIINPENQNVYRQLAGGLTTVNVLHGSANAIGGQNAVFKLKRGKPVEEWLIKDAPEGIKFALGENPKRSNFPAPPGTQRRYPATRMGVEQVIEEAFLKAKAYQQEWKEYEAKKATDRNAIAPRRDLQMEALVEILEGKRLVHAHCYRADEIVMLINLAEKMGFRVKTFQHVLEGYKVAKEIAAHGGGGSTFADFWGYKMEANDAIPYNAALMASRGVNVSINSDSDERARRLYLEAAKAVKYGGASEEEALRMITLNPAMQLGIDKRTGSIDVGKDADLVIFSHPPFSIYTVPEMTFIEGEIYFSRERDIADREKLRREKEELKKQLRGEPKAAPREAQPEVPSPPTGDDIDHPHDGR